MPFLFSPEGVTAPMNSLVGPSIEGVFRFQSPEGVSAPLNYEPLSIYPMVVLVSIPRRGKRPAEPDEPPQTEEERQVSIPRRGKRPAERGHQVQGCKVHSGFNPPKG